MKNQWFLKNLLRKNSIIKNIIKSIFISSLKIIEKLFLERPDFLHDTTLEKDQVKTTRILIRANFKKNSDWNISNSGPFYQNFEK